MGTVDYISLQPNQKANFSNRYDEEFSVATITRIRNAIAAVYINSSPTSCQSQHNDAVNNSHSTRAAITKQINPS